MGKTISRRPIKTSVLQEMLPNRHLRIAAATLLSPMSCVAEMCRLLYITLEVHWMCQVIANEPMMLALVLYWISKNLTVRPEPRNYTLLPIAQVIQFKN